MSDFEPRPLDSSEPALLEVRNVEVVYHDVILAVKGVSLRVPAHGIVALFGPNGAGKTSLVRAISGLLYAMDGAVRSGEILFDGLPVARRPAHEIARDGLYQIPEGGNVVKELSVRENLQLSRFCRGRPDGFEEDHATVLERFPVLKQRFDQLGGYLSGGEQQILSMAKAVLARPRLMVLDEPTLGLSPLLVQANFMALRRLNEELGVAMLVIEQNARAALDVAAYGYVMESGRIVYDGTTAELRENREIQEFYLGLAASGGRKSFRGVKHYKRRKRWLS